MCQQFPSGWIVLVFYLGGVVPDRFDLMEHDDVLASLRISSAWCALVNRSCLGELDLSRLATATAWLEAALVELDRALAGTHDVTLSVFDKPPVLHAPCSPTHRDEIIDAFRRTNEQVRTVLAGVTEPTWSRSLRVGTPTATTTSVAVEDLARHFARVSQTCSVDGRWIW